VLHSGMCLLLLIPRLFAIRPNILTMRKNNPTYFKIVNDDEKRFIALERREERERENENEKKMNLIYHSLSWLVLYTIK